MSAVGPSTNEQSGADWIRPVRAHENLVYVICANIGPFGDDGGNVNDMGRIRSEIVDFTGKVLARADTEEETVVVSPLDMDALRRLRTQKNTNYVAQLQPHLHASAYADADLFPANGWLEEPIEKDEENDRTERCVIDRMIANGLSIDPD